MLVESDCAAVQAIVAIVLGNFIGLAAEGELAIGNAIRIPADGAAEVGLVGHVAVHIIVAKQDVGDLAGAVRDLQRNQRCAEIGDVGLNAVPVLKNVKINRGAIGS